MVDRKTQQVSLMEYVQVLLRRRWLFISLFFAVSIIATVGSFLMTKIYKADTTILIEKGKVINPLTRGLAVSSEMQARLRTLRQEILSRTHLVKVIKKLDLDIDVKNDLEFENLIEVVKENLKIVIRGTDSFQISYQNRDPQKAMMVTSAIADLFIEQSLLISRHQTHSAFDFIKGQLEVYKKKLEESEKSLREFKEIHIGELPGAENINLSKLESCQASLAKTEMVLQEAQLKQKMLNKQLTGEEPLIVSLMSGEFNPLQTELKRLEWQLSNLLTKYTDKYPEVIKIKAEIENIKARMREPKDDSKVIDYQTSAINPIFQQLRRDIGKIEVEISTLLTRKRNIQEKIKEYQKRVESIPVQQQEWARLTRDYNVNENIYQMLLKRLEEARISRELNIVEKNETFRVLDPAVLPQKPFKPNRVKIILLGLILGTVAGGGAAFWAEYTDQSFKGVEDVKEYLDIPILGVISPIMTRKNIWRERMKNTATILIFSIYLLMILAVLFMEAIKKYLMGVS